jgi:DNA-binding NarL/FixJ family response regulator
MTHSITLFIAHQTPLFRFGLRSVLERSGMQIVGESASPSETLDLVSTLRPHVVLISAELSSPTPTAVEVMAKLWRVERCGIIVFDPAPSKERAIPPRHECAWHPGAGLVRRSPWKAVNRDE